MKIENKTEKVLWFALLLSFVSFAMTFGALSSILFGYIWLFIAIIQLCKLKNEKGCKHGRKMGK